MCTTFSTWLGEEKFIMPKKSSKIPTTVNDDVKKKRKIHINDSDKDCTLTQLRHGQTIDKGRKIGVFPKSKDFSKALYTIDIGQNDVVRSMYGRNVEVIPDMMQKLAEGIKRLYDEGARWFWIHNTGPHGCLSGLHISRPPYVSGDLDELGCLKKYNEVAAEFNKQLKAKIVELRAELKDAAITLVDVHTAKLKLFSDAKNLGFADPLGFCMKEGTVCTDPSKYILWDGVHYTEAANRLIAQSILDGALSDPPLPITHACYRSENM